MDPAFDRAGFEQSIHAEAFASGAEQRQQEDRQGVQQQEAVASLRITDAQDAQAHPEAQVFGIAKSRFDRPPFGVEVDDLACAQLCVAGGQMPSFFHALGVDADRRADLVATGRDFGAAQHARPSPLADPVGGDARLTVRRSHLNVSTKTNTEAETEAVEEFEQLDVAEAAIGQDRHGHALGQHLLQARQAEVLLSTISRVSTVIPSRSRARIEGFSTFSAGERRAAIKPPTPIRSEPKKTTTTRKNRIWARRFRNCTTEFMTKLFLKPSRIEGKRYEKGTALGGGLLAA